MSLYCAEMVVSILDAHSKVTVNVEYRDYPPIPEGVYSPPERRKIEIQRVTVYGKPVRADVEDWVAVEQMKIYDITWLITYNPGFLDELETRILEEISE